LKKKQTQVFASFVIWVVADVFLGVIVGVSVVVDALLVVDISVVAAVFTEF
jgi:hypothetical protein